MNKVYLEANKIQATYVHFLQAMSSMYYGTKS